MTIRMMRRISSERIDPHNAKYIVEPRYVELSHFIIKMVMHIRR